MRRFRLEAILRHVLFCQISQYVHDFFAFLKNLKKWNEAVLEKDASYVPHFLKIFLMFRDNFGQFIIKASSIISSIFFQNHLKPPL